jgi:uncharacterized protein
MRWSSAWPRDLGVPLASVVGSSALLRRLDLTKYRDKDVGDYTLGDILAELDKPGRDPRKVFEPPKFRDDIRELSDLKPDLVLEGVVTNVAAFGAFVDVGVHQDGLVHVSELADHFVKDPHAVVKVGDRISVRVLSVDLERKRISLSAKRGKAAGASTRGDASSGAGGDVRASGGAGADARRPPARTGRDGARGEGRRPNTSVNTGGSASSGSGRSGAGSGGAGRSGSGNATGAGKPGTGKPPGADPARFQNNPFADLLKKA